jgi:hypothetical protein
VGISRDVSKASAVAGARVTATDAAAAPWVHLVDELDEGPGHTYRTLDLADINVHEKLVGQPRHSLGYAYALVHLAAILRRQPQLTKLRRTTGTSWWTRT